MPKRIAPFIAALADKARAYPLLIIAIVALLPWLGVLPPVYGVATDPIGRLALGGIMGYWCDRWIFPYSRPHLLEEDSIGRTFSEIRRALIVAACVIGACLVQ